MSFENPIDKTSLQLVDIDVSELKTNEQKHDIKKRYLEPFLQHCSEIITKRDVILKELRDIISNVKVENYKVTLEESSENSSENFVLKMEKEKSDDDKFNFMIGVTLDDENILNF